LHEVACKRGREVAHLAKTSSEEGARSEVQIRDDADAQVHVRFFVKFGLGRLEPYPVRMRDARLLATAR
jgi:hypothetical protein